ncbi:hypothetical protein ACHHV8_32925 [Paenibacillus sp. TAB 01]|uniref:hypothetical protein n=1 Tax=Paenibacillus sp. TAB 01 TaxID=3368988 RepID=UPI003751B1AB
MGEVLHSMLDNHQFYIVYDDFTIAIYSLLDDVCEELAAGGTLYGYADEEEVAHALLMECFQYLTMRNT